MAMRACCAILILLPLALGASVQKSQRPEDSQTVGQSGSRAVGPSDRSTAQLPNRPTEAESAWIPLPFSHYEGILERMPFGKALPVSATAAAAVAAVAPPPPAFSNKLTLCAINRAPNGSLAVGFVDNGVNPPRNYYLDVGDSEDNFTVLNADIEQESAVIDKDGVSVTLKLPGSDRHVTSAMDLAALAAAKFASLAQPDEDPIAPPSKPSFTNVLEQLLSMELSIPPGVASPPLPILGDLHEETHKALASVIVIETNDTDAVAAHKENVGWAKEELRSHIQEGGNAVSYLQTLKDRRAAEIARQKEAREAAEAQVRELAKKLSQEELDKQLDAINKNLTDTGVDPIDAPDQE
jgi:hypothetical protein